MSRLKELRLHGFKTFADPTRFVFEPGVNAVIGPNGSGKSNMADAVRWVLGEQSNRSLRTRRADDVIFAGSEERKPQGMAEAILTLDNIDGWLPIEFGEVTIGRRAYRSGESEYLINGARARLRDVVDLLGEGRLGANELVVVGQGTVDAALSLRPEERRQLFEEAAGVKNLQVRKNEALARLARARDNLTRVSDLVGELRPQVRRLALQAQHQQEHDALGRRARALVGESHRRREAAARGALGEARRRAAASEAALESHRAELVAGRQAASDAEERYWQAEAAARLAAERREGTREDLIRAESRLEALRSRVADLERSITAAEVGLVEVEAALREPEGGGPADDPGPAIEHAATTEASWRAASDALAAADATLMAAEEALAEARRREGERIAHEARRGEVAARVAARREALGVELAAAHRAVADGEAAIEVARADAARAAEQLVAARERHDATLARLATAQPRVDAARHRAAELAERVGAMRGELEAIHERAERGARLGTLLSAAGWSSLLDAIEAPEDAWSAIEAVVGGELEQALVWREGDLVERLAEARGAARLLATDEDPVVGETDERSAALAAVGAARTLAEWIGGAPGPSLFRRVAVAPDLAALLRGWRELPPGWLAVTPHGDMADGRGLVAVRGRDEAPGGAAAQRHARRRELADALARLETEQVDAASAAARELGAVGEAARQLDGALAERDAAERGEHDARLELETLDGRLRRDTELVVGLTAELASAGEEDGAPSDGSTFEIALGALQRAAAESREERAAAAAARDAARHAWRAARGEADQAEQRQIGPQQAVLEARRMQLTASLPGEAETLRRLLEERAAAEATNDDARRADEAAAEGRRGADATREAARAELLELERKAGGGSSRLADLERAAQVAAVEASRHEETLVALARERALALESLAAADQPANDGPTGDAPAGGEPTVDAELASELAGLDDDALEVELRRVRRTLAQIGSVNPFAVEEHSELAARLDDLTTQDADLGAAIASTEELVGRLDGEIAEQFNAAFAAIGERFDEFCRLLFAGGSASLQLGDGEDGEAPGGIEIVVRPPGKRLQRLAMLSGGERALTGVALLFAMLSVNPVPFCILDEVDAALDEANIGRFADALRRLAETIDFVVITHNRATIEVADTIYGVTMTDAAVSRVVSLRLADLPAEVLA